MIAVDAMGGDFAPETTVRGAYNAARKKISIALYGPQKTVADILTKIDPNWQLLPIKIIECSDAIGMAEEPTRSILKKDSSLMRALYDVKQKEALAVVSAGNSGAAVVGSIMAFGRLKGIMRPALGTFIPTTHGSVFLMDIGANVDCKPDYLLQFAYMGHSFIQQHKGIKNPRIGLLSNGHERGKGSAAIKQAYYLLEHSSLTFVGNIESRDLFNEVTDVLICDGFMGNILLKGVQGAAAHLKQLIKNSFKESFISQCAGLLATPFLKKMQKQMDYRQVGGALLLGVNYPLIIAHGCSNAVAFENAILYAHDIVQTRVVEQFNQQLVTLLDHEEAVKKSLEPAQSMVLC